MIREDVKEFHVLLEYLTYRKKVEIRYVAEASEFSVEFMMHRLDDMLTDTGNVTKYDRDEYLEKHK